MRSPVETSASEGRPARPGTPARPPRIFTVPPGRPFLDTLARAILTGDLPAPGGRPPAPLELPAVTLLLPTRRATRAVQEAFLRAGAGRALLLPRIMAVSEGQEELSLLAGAAGLDGFSAAGADVPPAIGEMERRLALTELVMRWFEAMSRAHEDDAAAFLSGADASRSTPAQAAHLAQELARLIDMVETEGVSLAGLAGLVPETFSEHWQKTIKFLTILTEYWPAHLAERGVLSPMERRNRLIRAEAARLAAMPPATPVIVAGVTGSIPATAELMRAVAALETGAIVLPGLDLHLDEASWQRIVPEHPEHPQFGLKKLIDALGVTRNDVKLLGAAADDRRGALVSEAMRPSATTERWHDYVSRADRAAVAEALRGVSLIEAPSAQDEAEAVALILREALETPGRTAALVSPDRLLARRVAVRLEAWGIRVDDSAGRPFAKTVPGAFLDLAIEAAARDFAPAELVALLKHPLTRLGLDPFRVRIAARALEIAAFRCAYLGRGLDGVDAALERAAWESRPESPTLRHRAVRRLWEQDWHGARDLVARLRGAFAPLVAVFTEGGRAPLRTFARAHVAAAEALAALPALPDGSEPPPSPLWQHEAGEAASTFFAGLIDESMPSPAIAATDYADLYRSLVAGETVRPRVPVHPRLFIWGPFEARLQQTDTVVLGSLNDGTWPDSADAGPWLNRPMRAALGLPSPEERLGYAAHDFTQLIGAERVFLTRAEKIDGVPTVPSRWLLRLKALLDGMDQSGLLEPERPWLGWARGRDAAPRACAIAMPEPRPPVAARPRRMSVSRVETWIANPYAVYAREILGLDPLDPLGKEPGADLRGSIIHAALARFTREHPLALPADTAGTLVAMAREILEEYRAHPRVAAFWVPRFARFARWFAETEPERRQRLQTIVAETKGQLVLEAPAGPFMLTARADRIDITGAGIVITDYKTGQPPNDAKVTSFVAPQLPLEAAIVGYGSGFEQVPKAPLAGLRYIRASGGEPPGEERLVKADDLDRLAGEAIDGLTRLVRRFDNADTPYRPTRRPRFSYDFDPYAHLARIAEWSAATDDGEEG